MATTRRITLVSDKKAAYEKAKAEADRLGREAADAALERNRIRDEYQKIGLERMAILIEQIEDTINDLKATAKEYDITYQWYPTFTNDPIAITGSAVVQNPEQWNSSEKCW